MAEYIEREAVMEVFMRYGIGWGNAKVRGVINSIPAADVAPVRHGRLLNPNPYGECSLCGYLIDIRDSYNYCPNCGADMREVDNG